MHPDEVDQLVATMDHAAEQLTRRSARDRNHTLREIVATAMTAVPVASFAGVTVLEASGRITSTAPTGEVVARLDQAQAVLREGPCVVAVNEQDDTGGWGRPVVWIDDLCAPDGMRRWPRFAPEAVRNGVRSMLSLPLANGDGQATALNLYAQRPGVFDVGARATAALFADQAAIALCGAERAANLDRALATRDVIGQAKGILVERHHVGPEDAFAMLVDASQAANMKLHAVAAWLVSDAADPGRAEP